MLCQLFSLRFIKFSQHFSAEAGNLDRVSQRAILNLEKSAVLCKLMLNRVNLDDSEYFIFVNSRLIFLI
jgi:hypothetical protein